MNRPKIGLVLGGGGSRGLAHIGVLEVMVREQIPIDLIVGTSMGAVVGVLFALGHSPAEIARGMTSMEGSLIVNLNLLSARGRQRKVRKQLAPSLDGKSFADLKIPVIAMAVDMLRGREVALAEGPLLPAVMASSAAPGAFPPVKLRGMELADGGVIDSLATHIAYEQGVDKVIAVDVYPPLATEELWGDPISDVMGYQLPISIFGTNGNGADEIPTAPSAMWRSVRVMTWYLHQQRLAAHPPHLLLRPNVSGYGSMDFKDLDGPLAAGIAVTEDHLPELKALVGSTVTG